MSNFPEMEYKPMVVDQPQRVVDQDLDALRYLQLVYRGQIQAEARGCAPLWPAFRLKLQSSQ
jgi:hypothetical protein